MTEREEIERLINENEKDYIEHYIKEHGEKYTYDNLWQILESRDKGFSYE